MQMKQLALVAAMALVGATANAATSTFIDNGGVHEAAEFGSNTFLSSTSDIYNFTLGLPVADISSDLTSVPTSQALALTGTVTLWADNVIDTVVGTYAFGTPGLTSFGALAAGAYFYSIQASGPVGGGYSFGSYITPVPEPETYALMLAGLGAMAFVARRRKA